MNLSLIRFWSLFLVAFLCAQLATFGAASAFIYFSYLGDPMVGFASALGLGFAGFLGFRSIFFR